MASAKWRKFGGRWYKLKAVFRTKSAAKEKRIRWGGRVVVLPRSHPDYVDGYRYGLYKLG